MHNLNIKMKFDDSGNLVPANLEDVRQLKLYAASVKQNYIHDVFISLVDNNKKSLGQLAKVHAMIQELASFTGHTPDEMKLQVKIASSLAFEIESGSHKYSVKSFSECSKDELSLAIQSCIEIGDIVGCHMH